MKEQFVTYEIALKLKELGFNEKCFGYYSQNDTNDMHYLGIYQEEDYFLSGDVPSIVGPEAPLWQQAIDWFEENHNIIVEILPTTGDKYTYACYRKNMSSKEFWEFFHNAEVAPSILYETKLEARETAILKAIKLYQEKHNKNGI